MSKTDLLDEGRRQGFLTAYKIVKQAADEAISGVEMPYSITITTKYT